MNATFAWDDAGQINLPDALKRVFGAEPGVRVRVEVTADRIEIIELGIPELMAALQQAKIDARCSWWCS